MMRNRCGIPVLSLALALLAFTLAWAAPRLLSQTRGTYRPVGESQWIALKTQTGHPLLLVFWASWCGPCVSEIPNLNKVYEKYKNTGLKIIAVNLDQTSDENVRRIVQRLRILYPVALPSDELIQEYTVNAIPASYLYDKNGTLVREWIGPPAEDDLERAIQSALHGVETPTPPADLKQKTSW